MARRTDRGEETRSRILAAAAAAFAERGYAGTSMNELVRATGLTKGAFYFHFDSKEDLALEVFRWKHEEWQAMVAEAIEEGARALDQLVAVMGAVTECVEADPSARSLGRLAGELSGDPRLASVLDVQFRSWVEFSTDLLRRAQEEGDVRPDLDPREVSEVVVAGFIGLEHVSGTRGAGDLRRWSEALTGLVLDAIRAKEQVT
ncbi:MAG TPA: ScbR family autoregulator-binding transcription factor [Actinomycetota bacterium]